MNMRTIGIKTALNARKIGTRAALFLTCILLIGASAVPSRADEPMSVVQTTVNNSLQVLRNKQLPLSERQDQLRKIVNGTFDFKEMARSALGYHWRQITPAQQEEFTQAFVAFIQNSYLGKINEYTDQQVQFVT